MHPFICWAGVHNLPAASIYGEDILGGPFRCGEQWNGGGGGSILHGVWGSEAVQ